MTIPDRKTETSMQLCDMQDGEIAALYSRDDNLTDNNSDEEWEDNCAAIDAIQ